VYNKLEPQLFLLFDCHKYGELGSNAIFHGIDSWEPSARQDFIVIFVGLDIDKLVSMSNPYNSTHQMEFATV
jgi:hypothetical protein